MGDGRGSDDLGRTDGGRELDPGESGGPPSGGLDVDLGFLEDVESMDVEGMSEVSTREEPKAGRSKDGMTPDDIAEFRARWADVQASFIDDPSRACEQADNLVDLVLTRLTERFARERDDLVRKWDVGHEPTDTEDLRLAMKGYRGLIDRLLTTEL